MVRQLEAVYEHGILRPLQPLSLEERQHVLVTIADLPGPLDRMARFEEQEWIRTHGAQYASQWVALDGSDLVSHGSRARAVRDEARAKGVAHPLLVHLPDEPGLPSAGWL
jgi:predicted DNA-binding antitoxin AbrB/MazE fold protein